MLNVTDNGDITLTMQGVLIATIYSPYCDTLTPKQLVAWENDVRRDYYEATKGYWCTANEVRHVSSEAARSQKNPNWVIKSASQIREEYTENRRKQIDQ